jgi:hypothetical protein
VLVQAAVLQAVADVANRTAELGDQLGQQAGPLCRVDKVQRLEAQAQPHLCAGVARGLAQDVGSARSDGPLMVMPAPYTVQPGVGPTRSTAMPCLRSWMAAHMPPMPPRIHIGALLQPVDDG